jgi:hypothetical protein
MLPVSSEAQCPLRFGSSIIEVPNIICDRDHAGDRLQASAGLEDINKEPGKTQMWRVDGFNDN